MDPILLKQAEPVTLVTDFILGVQGVTYSVLLFRLWLRGGHRDRALATFAATFIFLAAFAFCGAISHGTRSIPLSAGTWPPTVILGGIAFFLLSLAVLFVDPQPGFRKLVPVFIGLLAGYLVTLAIAGWAFFVFVGYQLLCSILIFLICLRIGDRFRKLTRSLVLGLSVLLFAGMVQAVGAALQLSFNFGPQDRFLFKPHNDTFHLLAIMSLAVLYRGLINFYGNRTD
jgi:hypothetical protein